MNFGLISHRSKCRRYSKFIACDRVFIYSYYILSLLVLGDELYFDFHHLSHLMRTEEQHKAQLVTKRIKKEFRPMSSSPLVGYSDRNTHEVFHNNMYIVYISLVRWTAVHSSTLNRHNAHALCLHWTRINKIIQRSWKNGPWSMSNTLSTSTTSTNEKEIVLFALH